MLRLRLSNAARMDLHQIAAYTRDHWGVEQALRYVALLEEAFRQLEKMPQIGKPIPTHTKACRRINVGKHAIFYREEGNSIFIVRVLHQRMLPANHLSN